jgi:hypothetical protein
MNTLTLNNFSLYFGGEVSEEKILSYSLPPIPPPGTKDIRFAGDTKLCTTDECVLEVMNDGSPLTFECDIKDSEVWEIVDESGNVFECSSVNVIKLSGKLKTLILRISTSSISPLTFSMNPAHPNPFNPTTKINYSLALESDVNISIYNLLGEHVQTIVQKNLCAGNYSIQWNGLKSNHQAVPSGVYIVMMKVQSPLGNTIDSQKIVLLR